MPEYTKAEIGKMLGDLVGTKFPARSIEIVDFHADVEPPLKVTRSELGLALLEHSGVVRPLPQPAPKPETELPIAAAPPEEPPAPVEPTFDQKLADAADRLEYIQKHGWSAYRLRERLAQRLGG